MKRQSILVWIFVMTAGTSVYSADGQVDWVDGSNIPISWEWGIYPSHFTPSPHPPWTIPFSGPTGVLSNDCCAMVNLGGTPTITIDPNQKTIELWFQPPAPNECPADWDPVCGLNGWFGPLSEGDWLFYSNQIPSPYGPFYINFHVDAPPTLTILNPNGNEYLLVGSTYTIRWEDSRSEGYCAGNYLLDYSIDEGNNWIPVDSNTISNACSYDWLVPSIDANQCLIRITDAGDPNITDTSDQPFYVYHDLTILNPNGNEYLLVGSIYTIRWEDSRSEGYCAGNYLLDYSIDEGNSWIPVDSDSISNTCSYDWLVPSIFSNRCLIRITDANDPNLNDESDDSFSIYRCMSDVLGDWNGDCYVDFGDFSIIAAGWNVPGGTDINDLAGFVQYWLDCANSYSPYCCNFGEAQPDYPSDGAMISGEVDFGSGNIWTELIFIPGATAVEHTGYFNEDYSKVASRHPDANLGPPPFPFPPYTYWFFVGTPPIPPADETLVRGTTYYWTVDATDALGNTFAGDIWEFTILDFYAFEPNPPNETTFVETDVLLSWLPGFHSNDNFFCHDIYLGTSWEDVNNASYYTYPRPPEFVATVEEPNILVTGLLDNTRYYWRVDEIHWSPWFFLDKIYKGDVWSFTTTPPSLNNDGFINFKDYAIPSNYRQKTGPILPADSKKDDIVDYKDLRILIPAQ
jgi:hypothetical protein